MENANIITIDGSYRSGRHTLGTGLARTLRFKVGSFDRTLTHIANQMMASGMSATDLDGATELASQLTPAQVFVAGDALPTFTPDEVWRGVQLGKNRDFTPLLQVRFNELASELPDEGLVVVGTAMGRRVFPDAPLRIFLYAHRAIRAFREAQAATQPMTNDYALRMVEDIDFATMRKMGEENGLQPKADYNDGVIRSAADIVPENQRQELYIMTDTISRADQRQTLAAVARARLPALSFKQAA